MKNLKQFEKEPEFFSNINTKSNEKAKFNSQADSFEKLVCKHFENNFFLSSDTKRLDDYILHENYIKIFNDESRFNINYSAYSVFGLFKFLEDFQDLQIKEKFECENFSSFKTQKLNIDEVNSDNIDSNANYTNNDFCENEILNKFHKRKKDDIVLSFLNSHVNNIIDDINNSSVINSEAEQKLCFSLFIIKKIIKDFTFYFTAKDLELIFNKLKNLRE